MHFFRESFWCGRRDLTMRFVAGRVRIPDVFASPVGAPKTHFAGEYLHAFLSGVFLVRATRPNHALQLTGGAVFDCLLFACFRACIVRAGS
jgi:hypothetical protein